MPNDIDYPRLLGDIRSATGLTQQQLAEEISATFQSVNGWENGKHKPIRAFARQLLLIAESNCVTPRKKKLGHASRR
jgi:DNA-binding transcriptional regulator YiaG